MSLYYVTGTPGTGKTTIQKELIRRGYEALDIDQRRFGGPINLKTGERTTVPHIKVRSPDWFEQHEWRVSRFGVEELKTEAIDKDIYLCGVTTTEHLVWDLFDKVLYLNIDEETLRDRILNRADNDFGKGEGELDIIFDRYRAAQKELPTLEVTLIDANGSIDETVEAILREARS